jgi:hypothetical protein
MVLRSKRSSVVLLKPWRRLDALACMYLRDGRYELKGKLARNCHCHVWMPQSLCRGRAQRLGNRDYFGCPWESV